MRRAQTGVTTVEFAIVGALLMIVVFAIIEFGRALYVMNMLTEAARRGARMAAVCPVGDPKPASVAVFSSNGSTSPVVSGLHPLPVQMRWKVDLKHILRGDYLGLWVHQG